MPIRAFRRERWIAGLVLILATATGCRDTAGPLDGGRAELHVAANVQGTLINTVSVEVTAVDLPTPLLFNLSIANGIAQGTIAIPAGSNRTITGRAFDTGGIETHAGNTNANLRPGINPNVTITLVPHSGSQPVVITMTSFVIRFAGNVSVWTTTLARGRRLSMSTYAPVIQDAAGNPVAGQLTWATSNPGRATVTTAGDISAGPGYGPVVLRANFTGAVAEVYLRVMAPLSAGVSHNCGLTAGGAAYCWGGNATGQLGDGTTQHQPAPVPVTGNLAFESIAAGRDHTCGITAGNADLYCWGRNQSGQLGDSTTTDRPTPVPIVASMQGDWAEVVTGDSHTCARKTTGLVHCWGYNVLGALGDGSTTNRPAPESGKHTSILQAIAAGANHSCGLDPQGSVLCWGFNTFGQLGDGTTTNRNAPVNVQDLRTGTAGVLHVASLWLGDGHSCGLTTDGTAVCWGDNTDGQLGDGTNLNRPGALDVAGTYKFEHLSAGMRHSCGVSADGTIRCWGGNASGQLGDGTRISQPSPVRLIAGSGDLPGYRSVHAGAVHTCAIAKSGAAYCWGDSSFGGGTVFQLTPLPVSGGLTFP